MNTPLFSILIANYNNGRYLQEAIDSVKSQTYTNWEIIIVDDCSTDNSKELYKQHENNDRIKIYYNDENKGCGYTKHRCVELATGGLCGFLDPDDTLTSDALEIMEREHSANPKVSLICSRHIFCDENMNSIWESSIRDKSSLNYLTERFHTVEVFASFKKKLYDNSIGINTSFKRAVDQDLYYILEEQGSIIFIDDVLYRYRLHSNSLSIGHNKALYWHIMAMKAAAERRGLEIEEVVAAQFNHIYEQNDTKYKTVIQSSYYKFGYFILHPIYRLKNKLKKISKTNV